jgi:DNA mismatch repair protein MutL
MSDMIRLLPESVANQIAAGEVVQRPASAVKELLENSVDAGATSVQLIIKEAGKNLIQVIDNGSGMSERDARMCFERHATSKIESANDLLSIRTLGFRGEALASIASIAQVEIKTKRQEDEIGTSLTIDGSEFKTQLPAGCPDGTSIAVRNLFFNVPARRNFLKSNTLELKYIIDEFFRVALVSPGIAFTFYNNDKLLYQLPPSNLKQRVVGLFGNAFNQRLIPVSSETAVVNISGFLGKPEYAKKTRGEQYFFANGRFIKSAYLHHAVESAFQELIPKDAYPTYFLYLDLDPKTIDVNIHPTKTEINFLEAKSIYAILHSAVRQAIGKFSISPTLDFEREPSLDLPPHREGQAIRVPTITVDPNYNPFEKKTMPQAEIPLSQRERSNQENWQKIYDPLKNFPQHEREKAISPNDIFPEAEEALQRAGHHGMIQIQNRYIVSHLLTGIVIVDQQNAHERVLYEKFVADMQKEHDQVPLQKLLVPHTVTLNHADFELLKDHLTEIHELGFEVSEFGKNAFLVSAVPVDCRNENITELFEKMAEALKEEVFGKNDPAVSPIALTVAKKAAVKRGTRLQPEEMASLLENLFACKVPDVTMDGKPTMVRLSFGDLQKSFK